MGQAFKRILKIGSKGNDVQYWQLLLKKVGFKILADGKFGEKTETLTKEFQKKYGLIDDGKVGQITWSAMLLLIEDKQLPTFLRTEKELLVWIHENLGEAIRKAIENTEYSEDWLGSIAARETGYMIIRLVNKGLTFDEISKQMIGDYRRGRYNGYSYFQIDIKSFPAFIESGLWVYPYQSAKMAVICLDGKNNALHKFKYELSKYEYERAITAAYNCGEGSVKKAIEKGYDIDRYTFNKDYSKEVFRMRQTYKSII